MTNMQILKKKVTERMQLQGNYSDLDLDLDLDQVRIQDQEVEAAPVVDTWASGLIHRAKRSLLWRWNTLKPVGAGCRDNYECGTNYCRRNICTFQPKSSSS
ncbi:liver-expressed antimicrobial peptide 2-like [Silurus meridionalis]|nr:liver-expressed antimicrobial peptide 2-like [Silurus meridionalis]